MCMCGETKDHIIARRSTADGKHVALWSTGELTWALGFLVRGSARPRTDEQRERALAAGWRVMAEVELYDADEVSALVRAARWACDHGKDRRTMLSRLNARPSIKPVWTVLEADREGKALVRVWRLPRLSHPGLVVWDEARGAGSRGRYQVMREIGRSGTVAPTGFQFHSLAKLGEYLDGTRQ